MNTSTDPAAVEIKRLNGCINDLTAILALPAKWVGFESSQIINTLLDALLRMLHLDFAYVRSRGRIDGSTIETLRLAQPETPGLQASDIGRMLDHWLTPDFTSSPLVVPNPVGEGFLTIAPLRLGLHDNMGMLVSGSVRLDFPTEIEMLLLRMAVIQATTGLQELQRLSEQARAAVQIEQRVGKHQLQYNVLVDSLDEGFCTIEMLFDGNNKPIDYRFLDANPAFEKQAGFKDPRGRTAREIVPHLEEHWLEFYGNVALTGKPARVANYVAQLQRWFDVYAFRIGDPFENKVAVLFNDISDRKRTEEALQESEERFRRYFELGLVGMAMTSPEKGILEVNDEMCRILGYERGELLRKTWAEITHPDDLAADVAQFNRVLKGEIEGYTLDKRWIRKDGVVIDTIMSAKCQRRADGSVDYFVGLVQDTTARKQAEEDQRKLVALVENSPYFIGIASLEGNVQIINPAGRAMVGLESPAQVTQTRIVDFVVEEDREAIQQHVLPIVMREGQWEGETQFRHFKTGATIPIQQRVFLVREPETDRPVAIATFASDITEQRRSAEALRSAQVQLAHIARVNTMGELAASIAHEINQPLTAVVTNGDAALRWLNQTPPNVAETRAAIAEIVRQGHRASDVIRRIRALIRKGPRQLSTVDLNQLIEDVLVLTHHQLAEHGVKVRTQFEPNLPPVTGDSVQLQQVLVNLIFNAIDATTARSDSSRELVLTTERQSINEVLIAVHDSGTGIDPQHAAQLFRHFFTTKATGMGMGLAISRSIIEDHGGRLWATSNQGPGATFQFSLPVRRVE